MAGSAFGFVFSRFIWWSVWALACLLAAAWLLIPSHFVAVASSYLLSLVFVGSNFIVIRKIKRAEESKFYKQFFITLTLRFLLVVATLIFILKVIKFHQIYFTVSFIISYIFHSVIEIISINKILETDN